MRNSQCKVSVDKGCVFVAVGFICNVVRPLFTEWHRLLVSPLSLLLLDNLQANLQRWQSLSTDNVSLLTVTDSSDDSSPSNADQGDRQLLNVSSEVGPTKPRLVLSDGDGSNVHSGPQTQNLRRASLPPLSATGIARVTIRRVSSPVFGSQHVSHQRIYHLSSLAEDPAPLLVPLSTPCCKQLNTATEFGISRFGYNDWQNNVCKNGHKDVILTEDKVCLPASDSKHCSILTDGTCQFSEGESTSVIHADDNSGSNGALLNGVSVVLPKYAGVRRGSAPVICSARLSSGPAVRRCSAPSPGAELIAVSLWTSKLPFSAEPSSSVSSCQPSVVLIESPRFNVAVDQLGFVYMLNNTGSLKVPVEPDIGRCREKRSHSAHAVVISPVQSVEERRYSSPLSVQHCHNASSLVNQTSPTNSLTPASISGFVFSQLFVQHEIITLLV